MAAAVDPGLCRRCVNGRCVVSGKGSEFWRCAVSERIPSWPKYPRLPVLRCSHFVGTDIDGAGSRT